MFISSETITNLVKVKMFETEGTVVNEEANSFLLNLHKKLLLKAQSLNSSIELGILWNLQTGKIYLLKGDKEHVRIKNPFLKELIAVSPDRSLVFIHNHPNNGSFSNLDVSTFILRSSIYAATAVCHNGTIYMLRKDGENTTKGLSTLWANYNIPGLVNCVINEKVIEYYGSIKDTIIENRDALGITYRVSR